jgi:prophage maintenance system killer protein
VVYLDLDAALQAIDDARDEASRSGDDELDAALGLGSCNERILAGALTLPRTGYAGIEKYPDLPSKAAALAYGIVKAHAWIEGNKRASLILTSTFVTLNGMDIDASDDAVADILFYRGGI